MNIPTPNRKLLTAHVAHHWHVNRRMILIGVTGLVLAVIVGLIAILVLANNKASAYKQQVNSYISEANTQLLSTNKKINGLTVSDTASLSELQKDVAKLQEILKEPTPTLPGVFLGDKLSGVYRKSNTTTAKINQAKTGVMTELTWLSKFIEYNKQLNEAMNKIAVTGGLVKAAELAAYETNWKEAAELLKKASPTTEIQAAHTQIIDTLQTGSPIWKNLAETYQKADVNGYAKQKTEIDNQFKNLAKQGEAFHKTVNTHSKKLNDAFEHFLQLQKDL